MFVECIFLFFCSHNWRKVTVYETQGLMAQLKRAFLEDVFISVHEFSILCYDYILKHS